MTPNTGSDELTLRNRGSEESASALAVNTRQTADQDTGQVKSLQAVSENSATARFLEGGGAQSIDW